MSEGIDSDIPRYDTSPLWSRHPPRGRSPQSGKTRTRYYRPNADPILRTHRAPDTTTASGSRSAPFIP
jgi:hypothetical protein